MKKVFIISAVLLFVVLIFLGIYNFAFKKETLLPQQVAIAEPSKTTVSVAMSEKIKPISDGPVMGVYFDVKNQELKYYDALTGLVWKTDSYGQKKQQISMTKVDGIKSALWSTDGSKVLTTIQKEDKSDFFMYDYSAQKSTQLKEGLDTVVWDNLGTKIFYKYFDKASSQRTLNVANPDGSGWQKISDIAHRKINIAPVPFASLLSYWNFPNATEETQLQVVGFAGGEPKTILAGKYGADYLWAPDGSKALVSSLSSKDTASMLLGFVTLGGEYVDLNIPTLASKCAWSADSKTIYYALPGGIPDNAQMPNDYQENKFKTKDTFWKMDVTSGEKKRIIEIEDIKGEYDAGNMFLSTTEDVLYFINRADQKLYRISL